MKPYYQPIPHEPQESVCNNPKFFEIFAPQSLFDSTRTDYEDNKFLRDLEMAERLNNHSKKQDERYKRLLEDCELTEEENKIL